MGITSFRLGLVLIATLISITIYGQGGCDAYGLGERRDKGKGVISEKFSFTQHPITTFSYFDVGSIFKRDRSINANLTHFRDSLAQNLFRVYSYTNNKLRETYFNLFNDAIEPIKSCNHFDKKNCSQNFSSQYKAIAFVLLCNKDTKGDDLRSGLKDTLIDKWKTMSSMKPCEFPLWKGSSFLSWRSRDLIHYLQAYDLMMALAEFDNDSNLKDYLSYDARRLQELVATYHKACNSVGSFTTNADNHQIQAAGVLGMASIVLHDKGYNIWGPYQWPSIWNETAIWNIQQALFDNTGRTESQRGGIYGFAEGPYYFKYCMEVVLPYFVAMQNAQPIIGDAWEVKPYYAYGPFHVPPVLFSKNYIDEPWLDMDDIRNLFKWHALIQQPDGSLPTIDDTWNNMTFAGPIMLRDLELFYNKQVAFTDHQFSDVREEFVVAYVDGFYGKVLNRDIMPLKQVERLDCGNVVVRDDVFSHNLNEHQHYLHINAEDENQGVKYGTTSWGHEHEDAASFILNVGKNRLVFDPSYFNEDNSDFIKHSIHHSSILIDGLGVLDGSVTSVVKNIGYYNNVVELEGGFVFEQGGNSLGPFTFNRRFFTYNSNDRIYIVPKIRRSHA